MNKQAKLQSATAAARDLYAGESLQAQAIAALAGLATKGVLPKYIRDQFQQALIDLRLNDDPAPAAVETVEGESDQQYDARVVKAQRKHGNKVAAWSRKRVNRAMRALEKNHNIEVPRDARGGGENAKKAEAPKTGETGDGQPESKGTDERPAIDTSKAGQQAAFDTLMAATASRKETDKRAEALNALETLAAFHKLDSGLS